MTSMSDEFGGDRVIRHLVGTDRVDPGSGQRSINALPNSPPDGEFDEIFSAEVDKSHAGAVGLRAAGVADEDHGLSRQLAQRDKRRRRRLDRDQRQSIWPSAIAASAGKV
jgi:hypothetical protein